MVGCAAVCSLRCARRMAIAASYEAAIASSFSTSSAVSLLFCRGSMSELVVNVAFWSIDIVAVEAKFCETQF